MKDFLPFGDGLQRFVEGALAPAVVAVGLFAFLVHPSVPLGTRLADVAGLGSAERLAILGAASLVVAVLAEVTRPVATSLLSGEARLVGRVFTSWRAGSVRRFESLVADLRAASTDRPSDPTGLTEARRRLRKLHTEFRDLPAEVGFVAPTRFGNRLRAGETYGTTRFGLDTSTFFFELRAHAGEQVVADLDRQRLAVNLMVSSVVVAVVFSTAATVVALWAVEPGIALYAVVGLGVAWLCYWGACSAARGLVGAMRALVNEGRIGLAAAFGVRLPTTLEEERAMWRAIAGVVLWGPGPNADPWPGTAAREELLAQLSVREGRDSTTVADRGHGD